MLEMEMFAIWNGFPALRKWNVLENNKSKKKIEKISKKVLTKGDAFGIMYKLLARGAEP